MTLQPIADARTTLVAAGFKVQVIREETDDLTLDGYVLNQNPAGSTRADPERSSPSPSGRSSSR